ncbi:MAG: hypothetical protein HC836_43775 [Richelia sp. RM2_1_2]|nr:hypothetical protein [Richelia sp. RM2_1_2]
MRKTYYVNGIQVPTITDYLQIRKLDPEYTLDDFLRIFAKPDNPDATQPDELRKLWAEVSAFTPQEFVEKFHSNSEVLMTCFSIAGAEAALKGLKAKVINEETITKKQKRTKLKAEFGGSEHNQKPRINADQKLSANMFEEEIVVYKDTYKLHKIEKSELKTRKDIYVIECNCTSTDRKFFLFADSEDARCQKAIDAIAWTMRKPDGTCLTREEYITIEQES